MFTVAVVTVDNVTKSNNQMEVKFDLKKLFRHQKGVVTMINSLLNARHVSVDSCNAKLTSGKNYGLMHTPNGNPEYTFCDNRSVKRVKRALKQAKKASQAGRHTDVETLDSPVIEALGKGD